IDLQRAQVPVVDADDLRPGLDGDLGVLLVVDLHQGLEAEVGGRLEQLAEPVVLQRGDDEQHRVGSGGPGLEELVLVQNEVLAQEREPAGGAGLDQVVQAAAEAGRLREDRARAGPGRLVGAHDLRDAGPGPGRPAGRARPLDLGDQRDAGGDERLREGVAAVVRAKGCPELRLGHGAPPSGTLGLGRLDDVLEEAHYALSASGARASVAATNASRRPAAAPPASASRAASRPCASESAPPAIQIAAAAFTATTSAAGPGAPASTDRMRAAVSARPAPASGPFRGAASPSLPGSMRHSRSSPPSISTTRVGAAVEISSIPSSPCTTSARSAPSSASASAILRTYDGSTTPTTWRVAPAGFARGPIMLKIVRTPRAARTGATWRNAGWWRGAHMNPMPTSSTHAPTAP